MKIRTLLDVERELRLARDNHEIVKTPATAAYVARLERERAKMVVDKRATVTKAARKL